MVLQEDNVIFISTVRFLNAVYIDTDQKIKQICVTFIPSKNSGLPVYGGDLAPPVFALETKIYFLSK